MRVTAGSARMMRYNRSIIKLNTNEIFSDVPRHGPPSMDTNLLSILDALNPENIIRYGGLAILIFIIFAETGLFFGFFLPGDSLLFIAGLMVNSKHLNINVFLLILILVVAAVAGSVVGYYTGKWAGDYLKNKKENILYKKRYLEITGAFYAKHGMMAFVMGRFLPIIRTFVTIRAGMVKIEFKKFFIYNVLGATIWITVMVMAGYWLGNIFPGITEHLELIVIVMVLVSTIPVMITWWKNRKGVVSTEKP